MTSNIRIFNRWGEADTILENIPTTPRSWVLNGYGRCEFSISMDDPKCQEQLLQFGNLILVEHVPTQTRDEGAGDPDAPVGQLPPWAGIILPPRNWSDKVVHITAYSAEAILAYRALPFMEVRGMPHGVFNSIISIVNRNNPPVLFQLGQVDTITTLIYQDKFTTNAFDHIKKMSEFCTMDWGITSRLEPSSLALTLIANLTNRKTIPAPIKLTPDNTETLDPILSEQGTIMNRIYAYTQANTSADRVMQQIDMQTSIDKFGPFEVNKVYTGVTDPAVLAAAAQSRTAGENGFPKPIFKRVALNVGSTFDYLRVGNVLWVEEPRAGFNPSGGFGFHSVVRILSMDYNDLSDKVNLTIEILPGIEGPRRDMTRTF